MENAIPLPTPNGWTTVGELSPGDTLFDEHGEACQATAVSPVRHEPAFRVTFINGESAVVAAGHLRSSIRLDDRHALRQRQRARRAAGGTAPVPSDWRQHWSLARVFSTVEIAATLLTTNRQLRHAVPVAEPIAGTVDDLPVAPYVLGAWLGDGTAISPEITCAVEDRQIVDRIANLGENVRRRTSSAFAWSMAWSHPDRPLLRHRLRALGVLGNKHIPVRYLRASRESRLELLRGIMDTDGFNTYNSVGADFCSERLAFDLAELVRSFGCVANVRSGRATCNGVDAGTRYRLSWRSPFPPFHLERKRAAWVSETCSRRTIRTVSSVERATATSMRRIKVSSPSGMFLATRHFIPTIG